MQELLIVIQQAVLRLKFDKIINYKILLYIKCQIVLRDYYNKYKLKQQKK